MIVTQELLTSSAPTGHPDQDYSQKSLPPSSFLLPPAPMQIPAHCPAYAAVTHCYRHTPASGWYCCSEILRNTEAP